MGDRELPQLLLSAPAGTSFRWLAERKQWRLEERPLPQGQEAIPIQPTPFAIGRAWEGQLCLPDSPELAKVTSRWHCHITRGSGGYLVADGAPGVPRKPSVSGTQVNDEAIHDPRPLRAADRLSVGPWVFRVTDGRPVSVDIDPILKSMAALPSRRIRSDDPRVSGGYARVQDLFETLHQAAGPEQALQAILTFAVQRIRGAAVAALLENGPDGSVSVRMAWHRDSGRLLSLRFSDGLLRGLPPDRAVLLVPQIADPSRSQLEERITSGLVVPLASRPEPLGFLYMDNRGHGEPFAEEDLYLAHALANVAALQVALERNHLLAKVEQNMSQYFGQDVVRLILEKSKSGHPVSLGAREVEATILFADMQGFSAYCRGRGPEELSELLNPYYELCAEAIQGQGGHVDKFLGDGVLGAFGTQPIGAGGANHAEQAVLAARTILAGWSRRFAPRGGARIPLRFGLDTGRVMVGNFGFPGRMEYTVTGDAVNLAARMEKLAQPDGLALTDATRRLLGDRFAAVDAGPQDVHGCGQVRVWRL